MLEKNINVENWGYVANPAGGFQGLWWHFVENDEVYMYLQFEEAKLCIKIEYDGDDRSETRWKYYNKLIECAKNAKINVEKPARFGSGTYMTIGVVPTKEVFGTEIINVNSYHHQVLDKIAKGLVPIAWSAEGYCEALIHESLPIMYFQWHPERMQNEEVGKTIFNAFKELVEENSI